MTVLLVEPDPSVRRTLNLLLRELGHEVLHPDSPENTVAYLDAFWPDVIVMNYFQREQTATEFCSQIQDLFGELPSTLIHSSSAEHRFYALRFKEAMFLQSPFSPEELQYSLDSLSGKNPNEIGLTG